MQEKLKAAHYKAMNVLRFVAGVFHDARTRDRDGLFGEDWGTAWDDPPVYDSRSEYLSCMARDTFELANLTYRVRQPLMVASGRTQTAVGMFASCVHELVCKLSVRLFWAMEEASRGHKPSWGYPLEAELHVQPDTDKIVQNLDSIRLAILEIPPLTDAESNLLEAELKRELSMAVEAVSQSESGDANGKNGTAPRLSEAEQRIIGVVREAGHRLTTREVLAVLADKFGAASEGTTKQTLSTLVRRGLLTNRQDVTPKGYGLPEWE